jgi:hypothetical protein
LFGFYSPDATSGGFKVLPLIVAQDAKPDQATGSGFQGYAKRTPAHIKT